MQCRHRWRCSSVNDAIVPSQFRNLERHGERTGFIDSRRQWLARLKRQWRYYTHNISCNRRGADDRWKAVCICQSNDFGNHKDSQNRDNDENGREFHNSFLTVNAPGRSSHFYGILAPTDTIGLTHAAIPLRFACKNACSTICPALDLDFRFRHACGLDALGMGTTKPRRLCHGICRVRCFHFSPATRFGICVRKSFFRRPEIFAAFSKAAATWFFNFCRAGFH